MRPKAGGGEQMMREQLTGLARAEEWKSTQEAGQDEENVENVNGREIRIRVYGNSLQVMNDYMIKLQ